MGHELGFKLKFGAKQFLPPAVGPPKANDQFQSRKREKACAPYPVSPVSSWQSPGPGGGPGRVLPGIYPDQASRPCGQHHFLVTNLRTAAPCAAGAEVLHGPGAESPPRSEGSGRGTVGRPPSRKLQGGDDSRSLHKVLHRWSARALSRVNPQGDPQGPSGSTGSPSPSPPRCPSRRARELNTGSA